MDVNGNANVNGTLALPTANRLYFGNSDVAWLKGEHGASGYLEFGVNTAHMWLTRAGRLGIGTEDPETNLTIAKNATNQTDATIPTVRLTNLDTTAVATDIVGSYEFFSKDVHSENKVTGFMRNTPTDAGVNYDLTFGTIKTGDSDAVERVRIKSTGAIIKGNSGTQVSLGNQANTQIIGSSSADSSMALIRTAQGGGEFYFAAGTSGTNIANNNGLGFIKFMGYHTDGYDEYARIQCHVDGTNGRVHTRYRPIIILFTISRFCI